MSRSHARLPEFTLLTAAFLSALWLMVCVALLPATPGPPPPCVSQSCKEITDYYVCGVAYMEYLYEDCRLCIQANNRCQGAYAGVCQYGDEDQQVGLASGTPVCACDAGVNSVEAKDVSASNFIRTGEKQKNCYI